MSADRPMRVDGLESHEVDDGLVVYHASSGRVHSLNPTASVVFELCGGEHSENEIAHLVGAAWGLTEEPRDEVRQCIGQLRAEGVVT